MSLPTGIVRTREGVHVLEHDTHLSRWIEEHKRLDIAEGEIARFAKHIPAGGVVVDAGASLGDHTATYAKLVGPLGMVWAFEPQPLSFEALRLNFANAANVIPVNRGLAEVACPMPMMVYENAGRGHIDLAGTIIATMMKLDALQLGRLDFLHLDCEGAELFALRGARRTIARHCPVMVLEVNHLCLARFKLTDADLDGYLCQIGYRWEEMEPHHHAGMEQRDIICFPR